MKVVDFECRDYETAERLHAGGTSGKKNYRSRTKVCYGTYIIRQCLIEDEPIYRVELHGHVIVSFHFDGRIIVDGHKNTYDNDHPMGWWTMTTKKRINKCLPVNFRLYQKRKKWHLSYPSLTGNNVAFFYDGLNVGQFLYKDKEAVKGIAKAVTVG